jgi:nicotinamidase-related amidase
MTTQTDAQKLHSLTWDEVEWRPLFHANESALLVIDPQNDILEEKGNMSFHLLWRDHRDTIDRIAELVRGARAADMPVFWFRYMRAANGKDVFPGVVSARINAMRSRVSDMFSDGTWDIDIVDKLKALVEPRDFVIDKTASGCFEGTNLDKYLRQMGVKNVVLTGYFTDFCVSNTARAAYDKGYGTLIVGDACASYNNRQHDASLEIHRANFGPVVDTEETLRLFKA